MFIKIVFLAVLTLWGGVHCVFAGQPAKVRISYSSRSNSVTPFYLAAQKGFFSEEGMDAELIQINPRLGATAALNGDIDFTTTFGSTLRGIISGFPMKFVAVSVRKSEHFLVARPEFKELKDLKGKRLAVSTLFGTDQRAAEEILRAKGFPIDYIKPLALGDAPIRTQALRSGIVEAAAVSSPFDLTLKADGYRVLGGPQDIEFALPMLGNRRGQPPAAAEPAAGETDGPRHDEGAPLCF